MNDNIKGIVRVVVGYSKIPDEDGEQIMEIKYKLKPLKLTFLHKLFNIDPNDKDPCVHDVIYCYDIDEYQARALQPYVIDGYIDRDKYDFMLECYAENERKRE